MIPRIRASGAASALVVLLLCSSARAQKPVWTVELTTKLGVTATVPVATEYGMPSVTLGNSIEEKIAANYAWRSNFTLKLPSGGYLMIPFHSFRDAILKDGAHSVTLVNGGTVSGKLIGQIGSGGKVYDLAALSAMRMVQSGEVPKPQLASARTWALKSTTPPIDMPVVAEPRFAFGYSDQYKSGGMFYTWETRMEVAVAESFIIKVGAEEIAANLSEFAGLSMSRTPKPPSVITLTARNGTATSGSIILKHGDKAGTNEWGLVVRLPQMADCILLLMNPSVTLMEINR
jgi:hypothetical protein